MLSQQEAKNLIDKVIGYSKLPQCEAVLSWTEDAFIRFANNGITTSGYRITEQVFGVAIDKDVVRRILTIHFHPEAGSGGPSWLSFMGHAKDSLWSLDLFRCESVALQTAANHRIWDPTRRR